MSKNVFADFSFSENELNGWMMNKPEYFPESAEAMLDGIAGLYAGLDQTDEHTAFLLRIMS